MPLARRWLRSFCIAGALLRCEVCIVCIMHLDILLCNSALYNNSTRYEKVFTLILPLTLIAVWVGIQKWSGKGRYRNRYGFFCLVVLLWRPDGGGRKARQCFICIPLVGGLSPLRERIECHSEGRRSFGNCQRGSTKNQEAAQSALYLCSVGFPAEKCVLPYSQQYAVPFVYQVS